MIETKSGEKQTTEEQLKSLWLDGFRVKYEFRKVRYPRIELQTGEVVEETEANTKKSKKESHEATPEKLLQRHRRWLKEKLEFIRKCRQEAQNIEIHEKSLEEIKDKVSALVEEFSKELKVKVNGIFYRKMKTKWASMSHRGNLTVNTLVRFLPDELIEYIIFHELTHLIEKRHNQIFWQTVSQKFPNYQELEKLLFIYWFPVIKNQQTD